MSRRARAVAADLGIAGALGALAWALHARVLGLWFSYDDFWHLRHLLTHEPLEICCSGAFWREFGAKGMFTPLLFASLGLDLTSFGLDARAFYVHQLAAFALATALLYLVLRLWLARPWAALAALLFAAGPASASLVPLLMTRHYVEAIVLGLLAVASYTLAVRRQRAAWALVSALLYLAAALAKEIAVPLVLLLPLLPDGDLRTRLRHVLPHAAALTAYLALRLALVGALAGSYGWAVRPEDLPRLALALPGKVAAEVRGVPGPAGWLLLAALLAGVLAAALRGRRAALLVAGAACLALLPVLPVSSEMEPRYAAPAWIVAVVACAAGCAALARRGRRGRAVAAVVAVAVCATTLWAGRAAAAQRLPELERIAVEGRAYLALGPGDVLRRPRGHPASFPELRWLKEEHLGRPRGAGWFYDDLYLCRRGSAIRRLWEYDPARARVVQASARLPALRARSCGGIRHAAPLAARFERAGADLFWELGPYARGRWSFVLGDGVTAFEVPREGGFVLPGTAPVALRVRYDAPAGWTTYSPELVIDLGRPGRRRWARR